MEVSDFHDEDEEQGVELPDPAEFIVNSGESDPSGVYPKEIQDMGYQRMLQREYERQFAFPIREVNLARPHEYRAMVTARLNGKIGDIDYMMLIDSGSELNIMTLQQAQDLALPIDDSGNSWTLKGISGHTMGLEGICWNVPVMIGGIKFSHNFFITRSDLGNKDMVLGQPWLFSHSTRIDYIHDMGVTLQLWENGDRKGRSVLINLLLVKAPRNVMPMSLRRNNETYGMERMPPSEFSSRAVEVFQSPEVEFRKPRPIGQDNSTVESASTVINLDPVKLGSYFPSSESLGSLLQVEDVLDQSQETSPALINEPPKLDILDFGDEFGLESLELPECSEEFDSRDIMEISSSTLELGVEKFVSASPEPNAKSILDCSVNLEMSRIDASTGNPVMRDPPSGAATHGTALECNLAHYEANPHRFQLENRSAGSGYDRNRPTSTRVAQMSRRPDHGYRGQFSSRLTPSYPRLHPAPDCTRASALPTMGRDELEQRLRDLRKCICLSAQFETKEPQKAPDKFLEAAGRHDRTPSHYAARPSRPNPINVTQIDGEQSKCPRNQSSRSIPIHTIQDGGNLESTRVPRPRKGPDKSFEVELMHDYGPSHSIAPDKRVEIEILCDHVPPHPVAGLSHPVPANTVQNDYERESRLRKGPDKSFEADVMHNCAPLPSAAGPSRPILVYPAGNDYEQRNEVKNFEGHSKLAREAYSSAWMPETVESLIHKLKDITDMGWRLKTEYDDHIEVLNAKLREQESLIDQLKGHTAMLRQELKDSSIGVHRFCDDFLSHMKDSIESIQAFKDMTSHIRDHAITTSSGRENTKKNQNASRRRWHWTQNKKGKGRAPGEHQVL